MRLIITRHGQTEENIAGIIQGHLPGKLSELGIDQAKKVALRLKDEKLDIIYSSDLARVADTTKEIARFHPNTPIKFVQALREKFLGSWQGKKKKELGLTKDTSLVAFTPPDGETTEQLFNRATIFLHQVLEKHHKDTVLFVSHNGMNKAIIASITGKNFEDIKLIENLHNTSICIFEIDEDRKHNIVCFNCKKHLD